MEKLDKIWFCMAAFLLLNLVTGAVINNYQISIEEEELRRKQAKMLKQKAEEEPVEEVDPVTT